MSLRAVAHGVVSLNGENGAIMLTSPDGSISITIPSPGIIAIEDTGGGGTSYWTLSGNNIYNNNSGGVGVGQANPLAQLHVTPTIAIPTNFTASIVIGATTGYAFGSGDKAYSLYGENTTAGVFTNAVMTTFTEPPIGNYDPTTPATAAFNFSGAGYLSAGYDFQYNFWALYNGNTQISNASVLTTDTGFDPSDGSPYSVDVAATPPGGTVPSGYLILCQGGNPNTGLYQIISGASFSDNGSGWGSVPTTSALLYDVGLGWSATGGVIDNYIVANTTTSTYISAGNTGGATDDTTWTAGSPTVTPVGNSESLIVDGALETHNGVPYSMPSSNISGFLNNDGTGILSWTIIGANNIGGLAGGQLVFTNPSGFLSSSSSAQFDGTSMKLNAEFGVLFQHDTGSSGTLNNYSTSGFSAIYFNGSVIITGFASFFAGKQLSLAATSPLTLKNLNGGSSSSNQISTPGGVDVVVPAGEIAMLQYDPVDNKWHFISVGKPDVTVLANTWLAKQIIQLSTTQLQLGFDGTHFSTFAVSSTGSLTIALTGTSPQTTFSQGVTFASSITLNDNQNLQLGSSSGNKIGTATTQKLGFWNVTPIVQPINTTAIDTVLTNTGLRASGGTSNFAAKIFAPASTTGSASLNIPSGAAPTSPANGDIWYDGTHLQSRLGSTTYQLDRQAIAGSFSGVGTATTTFTVTIGTTQANTSYKTNVTPTTALAAAVFYINNKTTTTFDVVYIAGLTGTVTFDWSLFP